MDKPVFMVELACDGDAEERLAAMAGDDELCLNSAASEAMLLEAMGAHVSSGGPFDAEGAEGGSRSGA